MEPLRSYVLKEYSLVLSDKNISKKLEIETYNYALERSGDNTEDLMNIYKQIYIRLLYNLKFHKRPETVSAKTPREEFSDKWATFYRDRTEDPSKAQGKKGAHKCGKCGSWDTSYTEKQTRSADEPMTTFVLCHVCGNRYRYN